MWVDLAPVLPALRDAAAARDRQKRGYASSRYWNQAPHFLGLCGEYVVSVLIARPVDLVLRAAGDGGADFVVDGVRWNVKGSPYWRDPHLKRGDHERVADFYLLVGLDLTRERGVYVGYASHARLCAAPLGDFYGHGACRVLHPHALVRALPPPLGLDLA